MSLLLVSVHPCCRLIKFVAQVDYNKLGWVGSVFYLSPVQFTDSDDPLLAAILDEEGWRAPGSAAHQHQVCGGR